MTLTRFVVKNSTRNMRRTALTVFSIGVSLFLLIALRTTLKTLTDPPRAAQSDLRIVVRRNTALGDKMPIAYLRQIEKMPHVKTAMQMQWFGGQYKDPKYFFPNLAVDPERFFDLFPEYIVANEAKAAFKADRRAAIVGDELLERRGWKIGDTVTLKGTMLATDLEFKIVGTYTTTANRGTFYFNYDYMNESLGKPNNVSTFFVMADGENAIPGLMKQIDETFHNTPAETMSETEKSFMLSFTAMLGNVQALVGSVSVVILFTMLLVTASTMAMTIRERFREIGILKSLGFPGRTVLALILGEAVFLALVGAIIGSVAAYGLGYVDVSKFRLPFLRSFHVSLATYALAFVAGAAIGVGSGIIPALQASRMSILQAMKRMD